MTTRLTMLATAVVLGAGGIATSVAAAGQTATTAGFLITSQVDNRCLDISQSNTGNGALVDTWDCDGTPNQRWHFDGGRIRSDLNNKCLDVAGGNGGNGGAIDMLDCQSINTQTWQFESAGLLRNPAFNRCLEIVHPDGFKGAALALWDCDTLNPAQRWQQN
jgi:hypothetical protein